MDTSDTIQKALSFLSRGKIILYPTDTIWGIGCDATNEKAIRKVNELKDRKPNQPLLILVSDTDMLQYYVEEMPAFVLEQLGSFPRPTTIIYPKAKNLPVSLLGDNSSIGIRIVDHHLITKLIAEYGKPLVSTSANKSGTPAPRSFNEINKLLLHKVDYCFPLNIETYQKSPSDIYKIEGEKLIKIR